LTLINPRILVLWSNKANPNYLTHDRPLAASQMRLHLPTHPPSRPPPDTRAPARWRWAAPHPHRLLTSNAWQCLATLLLSSVGQHHIPRLLLTSDRRQWAPPPAPLKWAASQLFWRIRSWGHLILLQFVLICADLWVILMDLCFIHVLRYLNLAPICDFLYRFDVVINCLDKFEHDQDQTKLTEPE